jgi:DNA-directed RNA polymerase subunit RPC12/RpoP
MPLEITQSNSRVAEVRAVCDNCGKLISIRFMLKTQVEAQKNKAIVCQNCKEERQLK